MNNLRISNKERNLIKGAIRRIFSRSELRKQVIEESVIKDYSDPLRPKVQTWCRCKVCKKPEAKSYMECDHNPPIVPLNKSLIEMSWDELIDNLWCDKKNLDAICSTCHYLKSAEEAAIRRKFKKEKNKK